MSFSNILEALDLAGIPLRSAERTSGPFVICGGPCAFNPEPLAPFVDLFVLGDGEVSTHQTIEVYKQWKASGLPREEYLRMAAQIPGVYVPSFYDVSLPRRRHHRRHRAPGKARARPKWSTRRWSTT